MNTNSNPVDDTKKTSSSQNLSFNQKKSSDSVENDTYFNNLPHRHQSFKEHHGEMKFTGDLKTSTTNVNQRPTLSSLNNSNLIKKESIPESIKTQSSINSQTKKTEHEYNRISYKSNNNYNEEKYEEVNTKLHKPSMNSRSINSRELKDEINQNKIQDSFTLNNLEMEFKDAIMSLKQIKSVEEVKNDTLNELEQKAMIKIKGGEDKGQNKLKKAFKKKQQAYKILLLNKYTEAKYRRVTVCGIILILFIVAVFFVYFSDSAKETILKMINNIPIEIDNQ